MVRIIGATEQETANTVSVIEGPETHVRCGADILLSGMYQDVRGKAVCPVCGKTTAVRMAGGQVSRVAPASALLHYLVEDDSKFSICCEGTFIFDREECLNEWLNTYNDRPGEVSSLPEFVKKARERRRSGYAKRKGAYPG
jgi:hypothetical protein